MKHGHALCLMAEPTYLIETRPMKDYHALFLRAAKGYVQLKETRTLMDYILLHSTLELLPMERDI
jgi:hypothetical protein